MAIRRFEARTFIRDLLRGATSSGWQMNAKSSKGRPVADAARHMLMIRWSHGALQRHVQPLANTCLTPAPGLAVRISTRGKSERLSAADGNRSFTDAGAAYQRSQASNGRLNSCQLDCRWTTTKPSPSMMRGGSLSRRASSERHLLDVTAL
jgi:hypothetical protein